MQEHFAHEGTEREFIAGAMAQPRHTVPPRELGTFARVRGLIAQQDWLDPIASALQEWLGKLMRAAGPNVTDFWHGTWLKHPLHVALTDVPVGAWTTAAVLDTLDMARIAPVSAGADAAVAVGVAAAVPTALSGLADWRHVSGYPRRVGLLHALLNTAGLLCQVASLVLRTRGQRGRGVALSSVGLLMTGTAAWFGGELVEEQGIGVDHSAFVPATHDFVPVMNEADLIEGRLQKVQAGNAAVLLYRCEGEIYAIAETCAHQGGPLSEGRVEDGNVVCPWHGSQYRLADGALVHGPSTFGQPRYEVRVAEGRIEVRRAPVGG